MDLSQIQKYFSIQRILFPVILGLAVAGFLVFRDYAELSGSIEELLLRWTFLSSLYIFVALLLVAIRDLAYMYRIRLLTGKQLKWKQSFEVIMLWEFASSLTPSVVGGSAVAMFILNQEKISGGRSTAIVLVTALLDELFYIVMVPLVFVLAGREQLFHSTQSFQFLGSEIGLITLFFIGYTFILLLTLSISFGVFVKPEWLKKLLVNLFKLAPLRRWSSKAEKLGNDIVVTSEEMRGQSWTFWGKAFLSTVFSWSARFAVVNFLIMAINPQADNALVYARQLVMWVVLLISPTPGGSGIAEYTFPLFLGDFLPEGLASPVAMLWRLFSYYPYLVIGSIVLPLWLKRVLKKNQSSL